MYARIETIEEECLDWKNHLAPHYEKIYEEVTEAVLPPVSQDRKAFLNNSVLFNNKLDIRRKITTFLNQNLELTLLFSILTLPYIVGFLISYFLFYFYGGMSISSFISIQGHLCIGFWSIGAYLFITAGVIWTVLIP